MVVVYQTAIATDGDVQPCFLEVLVTSLRYVNDCRSLTTADTLLLTGDTDRATADTDLDEVSTSLGEVAEAFFVDDITCSDEYLVAVLLTDPTQGLVLPFGVAIGGVDAEDVCTSFDEGRDTLSVVTGVDTSPYEEFLRGLVGELDRIVLVCIVVLAEDEVDQVVVFIDDGEGVELMLPDDVVRFLEGDAQATNLELSEGSHEVLHQRILWGGADAVVTAGDHPEETTVRRAVFCDPNGRVSRLGTQSEDIAEGGVGANV